MRVWTFGRKLGVAFTVMVLLTLTMGAVAYFALDVVVARKDHVITAVSQDLIDAEKLLVASQAEVASMRAFLLTREERFLSEGREASQDFASILDELRSRGVTNLEMGQLRAIEVAEAAHQEAMEQMVALLDGQAAITTVVAEFETQVAPRFATLEHAVETFVNSRLEQRQTASQEATDAAASARVLLLVIVATVILAALLLVFYLTRSLTSQIGQAVQNVRSSSAELRTTATQQASGAKEQATAMNEVNTTVNELLASSRQIAESAKRVAGIAAEAADAAQTGDQTVLNAQESVGTIRQQVELIVNHMLDLGKKSQQIGGILEIINELAEQTNILSINATIEAAGAGESGRRFAVVGEEIRKLADRVGDSTKEVRSLIDEIRAAVNSTIMATESGAKSVESGSRRFSELAAAFQRIGDLVETTTDAAREIELSTRQQSSAVEQVNVAVSNVALATKEAETGSRQTVATASELAGLSDRLARLVQAQRAA